MVSFKFSILMNKCMFRILMSIAISVLWVCGLVLKGGVVHVLLCFRLLCDFCILENLLQILPRCAQFVKIYRNDMFETNQISTIGIEKYMDNRKENRLLSKMNSILILWFRGNRSWIFFFLFWIIERNEYKFKFLS